MNEWLADVAGCVAVVKGMLLLALSLGEDDDLACSLSPGGGHLTWSKKGAAAAAGVLQG